MKIIRQVGAQTMYQLENGEIWGVEFRSKYARFFKNFKDEKEEFFSYRGTIDFRKTTQEKFISKLIIHHTRFMEENKKYF